MFVSAPLSSYSSLAPPQCPSHSIQSFMNFSNVGYSHRVRSFRNRLQKHGSPRATASARIMLWHGPFACCSFFESTAACCDNGVLHRLQVDIYSTGVLWAARGQPALSIHGLQLPCCQHLGTCIPIHLFQHSHVVWHLWIQGTNAVLVFTGAQCY